MKKAVYISILISLLFTTGCSQTNDKMTKAEMTFKADVDFDYGKIKEGSDGIHEFEFKNTGKDPLIITNVKSSCGCTVPTYTKEPIKEGGKDKITVKYDTGHLGSFRKTVTVYSNAKNSPVILHIFGEVIKNEN
jgi:hypothetical protein